MSSEPQSQPVAEPAAEPKSKKRVIPPAKWAPVEQAWKDGKFATLADLAHHFKMSEELVTAYVKRKRLKRGSSIDDYNRKVQEELEKKAAEQAKLLADRVEETRDQHYRMASNIAKIVWEDVVKTRNAGIPMSTIKSNLQAMETATKILKMVREERFAVLGLDKESPDDDNTELPELLVSELTPEQMEELRAREPVEEDEEQDIVDLEGELQSEGPEDLVDGGGDG